MRLKDRIALVTGSSRGIGRAIALTFAREGANVVVNYIKRADKAAEVVQEIEGMGRRAISIQADISKRGEVDAMVEKALEEYGRIDILVNNAGIPSRVDLLDVTQEDWNLVMDTNLKGAFNCTQAVARHMVERKSGKIVNISSLTGLGNTGRKDTGYAISKGGVIALTKESAFELGQYGINVNSIAPGVVITDITYDGRTEEEARLLIETNKQASMLGKVGAPQDIANVALFLASDESSFITGQVIVADGGRINLLTHSA